jgi:hypothetical protein
VIEGEEIEEEVGEEEKDGWECPVVSFTTTSNWRRLNFDRKDKVYKSLKKKSTNF